MIRILLVEDDPVIRDTTSYFLKCQQNFEVVCADTGGEALSHAREKFDVILMDIPSAETPTAWICASACAAGTTAPSFLLPVWTIQTQWYGHWNWAAMIS